MYFCNSVMENLHLKTIQFPQIFMGYCPFVFDYFLDVGSNLSQVQFLSSVFSVVAVCLFVLVCLLVFEFRCISS